MATDQWGDPIDPENPGTDASTYNDYSALTLNANTGKVDNSPNSPWYSDLGGTLRSLDRTALETYNALQGKPTTGKPGASSNVAIGKFLPWIIGGVALIVLVPLFLRK